MQKTLIVFYSRSGHTQKVAEAIAEAHDADLEAIRDVQSRNGIFGYFRSGREAWRQQLTDIQPVEKNPEHYDLVVIGTPVWAGQLSSPVRTYVAEHHGHFKEVAFFCTEGGSGGEKVFKQLEELCGRKPVTCMILTERELKSRSYLQRVAAFAQSLKSPSG